MELSEWLAPRGRTRQLARALARSESLVTQWKRGKPVAVEQCTRIERGTNREVRRWDLRPDDWHEIWPELVGAPGAPAVEARNAA